MALILGIDEAGRGPLIGPLVMAGVLIDEKDEPKLKSLGVKDSKLVTKEKREELFDVIKKISKKYKIIIAEPKEVDDAVNGKENLNLNWLEAEKSIDIIKNLDPDKVFVDCPSTNIIAYTAYLKNRLDPKIGLVVEHKADFKYLVVAAASILAKVTRDNLIEEQKRKIGIDFGSGYMSDPKTAKFLDDHYKEHKGLFRHSWQPYKHRSYSKNQTKLGDFSEKKEKIDPDVEEKIKKLEKLGYQKVDIKTSHEIARLKGSCAVTFYKTGKILVQGKDKEVIEKILH